MLSLSLLGCHKGLLSISSDDLPPQVQKPQGETEVIGFDEVNRLVFADPGDRNSCVSCHGEGISIPLVSYADYKANLDKVMFRVLIEKTMPRSGLSPQKLAIVQAWVDGGAQEWSTTPSTTTTTTTTTTLPPVDPIPEVVKFEEVNQKVFSVACARCHGIDGFELPQLASYSDFKSNLDLVIQAVLIDQTMPPRGLKDDQLLLVQKWIDDGAQE